jgi:HEAT repeat protein
LGEEIQVHIDRLKHEDPDVRYWAVLYLEHVADAAAVPALIEVLTYDDNDPHLRRRREKMTRGSAAPLPMPCG